MRRSALRLRHLVNSRAPEADSLLAERLLSCSQAGTSGSLAASMQRAGFSSLLAETYGNSRSAALFRFLFGQNAPKAVGVGMLRSRFSAEPNKGKC
jgi:hypothetical protein